MQNIREKNQNARKKLESLPVEVKEYRLDDDELICDVCGKPLTVMKKEVRKELVVIPAEVKVVEHVTYSYSCRNCDSKPLYNKLISNLMEEELLKMRQFRRY